jgi:hypothetical protein
MAYEPFASRSRAVLIGVAKYEHTQDFANIPSAISNTAQLRAVLTSGALGRLIPRTVETLAEPATRDRALEAIRTAVAQAQDLLFCYFSGHGYIDLEGDRPELYLMTRESTKAGARLDGIPYTALLQLLASSRAERVVLVLDCCFAGNAGLLPLPDRPFSLITSSRVGSRIHKGDGIDPTPFTAALVRVLREGTHTPDPVTVGTLGIRLGELAAEQGEMPDADYDPWQPTERSSGGAGDTVLSQARRPRPTPAWLRALGRVRLRLRRIVGYAAFGWTWTAGPGQPLWHRAVGGCTALALLAGGVTGYTAANRPAPLCPAPLELRVLTSPETRGAVASVLDAFQESAEGTTPLTGDGSRPDGCGQINTTVYSAPTDKVAAAFRDSAAWAEPERACASSEPTACNSPLVEVGAHPDVWIPESSSAYTRVREAAERPESVVDFGTPRTLARSPAVVAATEDLPGVERNGSTLAQLVKAADDKDITVRSADPRSSDAALDLLLHLPATARSFSATDDRELVCEARTGLSDSPPQRLALLTAESTVAALTTDLDSRPPCLGDSTDSYAVYYPRDVPPLDLTYIPVTWETSHADRADRTAAVQRLAAWLTSPAGQRELATQGFRTTAAAAGSWRDYRFAVRPVTGSGSASAARISALLASYAAAGEGRRDVLFAVDVSSSAYSGGNIPVINSLLARAAKSLNPKDRYGILAVPGGTVLALGTHSGGQLDAALRALRAVKRDAPISAALADAPSSLSVLVLVTDDEDSARATAPDPPLKMPVVVVSLEDFGCALAFNKKLTAHDGTCIDTSEDIADRLVEALA